MQIPLVPLPGLLTAWWPWLAEVHSLLAVVFATGYAFLGVALFEQWADRRLKKPKWMNGRWRGISVFLIMFALSGLSLVLGLYLVAAHVLVPLIFFVWCCVYVNRLGLEHR